MRLPSRLSPLIGLFGLYMFATPGAHSQTRAIEVQDLISLESLDPITSGWLTLPAAKLSPDGQWLAFVVERSRAASERYSLPGLDGAARADIWVVPARGGTAVNVTGGAREARGYWCPTWSADGRRLAMVSTQGDIVQVYVWDRAANTIRRISERGTDIGYTEITAPNGESGPLVWKDANSLVVGLLSAGETGTVLDRARGVQRFALAQWGRAKHGYEATSSLLGFPLKVTSRHESIAIVDVLHATLQLIGTVPSAGRRWIRIAPGWQQGAVLTQLEPEPMRAGHPPNPGYLTQVGVFSLSQPGITWNDSRTVSRLLGWKQGTGFIVSAQDNKLYGLEVDSY